MVGGTLYRNYDRELEQKGIRLGDRVIEPQPFCWMCSAKFGRRAKEHIFPLWLVDELKARGEKLSPSHYDRLGRLVSARGPMSVTSFVGGEVCRVCNNGWMSRLERDFKAIIYRRGRMGRLTSADQQVIARWFVKTSIVLNTSQNYRLLFRRAARHAVVDRVPRGASVFLSRTRPQRRKLMFAQGSALLVLPGGSIDVSEAQRKSGSLHMCGIRIDDLQALVVYWPTRYRTQAYGNWTKIAPNPSELTWDQIPLEEQPIDEGYLTVAPPELCPWPGRR